ncbi:hypothetical protein C818_01628 [Lachnospiraceae bacterium MD308]|jgi:hypothetical protein|nr:hypothetical protein C818_01628 [Lachnospiraceae bacterium MD308]
MKKRHNFTFMPLFFTFVPFCCVTGTRLITIENKIKTQKEELNGRNHTDCKCTGYAEDG